VFKNWNLRPLLLLPKLICEARKLDVIQPEGLHFSPSMISHLHFLLVEKKKNLSEISTKRS
jgi:hypothetical protein